jgi:hypothetical protein
MRVRVICLTEGFVAKVVGAGVEALQGVGGTLGEL